MCKVHVSIFAVCSTVDPSPSYKCGSDVPESSHWEISFQVSVLVINRVALGSIIRLK